MVVLLLPIPSKVSNEFILEPAVRDGVRVTSPGVVSSVWVREGQSVAAGAPLATLTNPALQAQFATAQAEMRMAQASLLDAQSRSDLPSIARFRHEQERWAGEVADARNKLGALVLRAAHAGVVVTPQIQQRIGEYLEVGEIFAVVADRRQVRARVLVRDWEAENVRLGALALPKTRAFPFEWGSPVSTG